MKPRLRMATAILGVVIVIVAAGVGVVTATASADAPNAVSAHAAVDPNGHDLPPNPYELHSAESSCGGSKDAPLATARVIWAPRSFPPGAYERDQEVFQIAYKLPERTADRPNPVSSIGVSSAGLPQPPPFTSLVHDNAYHSLGLAHIHPRDGEIRIGFLGEGVECSPAITLDARKDGPSAANGFRVFVTSCTSPDDLLVGNVRRVEQARPGPRGIEVFQVAYIGDVWNQGEGSWPLSVHFNDPTALPERIQGRAGRRVGSINAVDGYHDIGLGYFRSPDQSQSTETASAEFEVDVKRGWGGVHRCTAENWAEGGQ